MSDPRERSKSVGGSWAIGYLEARAHALIAAIILWTGAALVTFGSGGDRNLIGHLKGEDFLQVYTLAHSAFEGAYPTPATQERFYARQIELVASSKGDVFLPVYPPTAALLFRPLTPLSYIGALTVWTLLTVAAYGWIIRKAWRPVRSALPDATFVARAAMAFPPFFLLVLYGQMTIVPLLAFFLAWLALKSGHRFAAGLALGLLSIKPQFGLVIGVVLLLGGNWAVLLGLLMSMALQGTAVTLTMGTQALSAYMSTLAQLPQFEHLLEPNAWRMHSLRTLTRLLPQPAGEIAWAAATVWVLFVTVRLWRGSRPLEVRLGMVVLATVLVNPHLFVYDATLLALYFLWVGGWLQTVRSRNRRAFWQATYLLCVLLLLPTALVARVQLSVIVMLWLFWRTAQELGETRIAPATRS